MMISAAAVAMMSHRVEAEEIRVELKEMRRQKQPPRAATEAAAVGGRSL
jgi:hypothetical protein